MNSEMAVQELFNAIVKYRARGDRHEYRCPLGFWSVDAPDKESARREAIHYFCQYDADGEYDRLVVEKINTGSLRP